MMRLLVTAALVAATAALIPTAPTARADVFSNTWLRGASSVAVNDDATALFINPAGLGMYGGSNSYASLSMSGEDVLGISAATKMGPLGLGYDRQYLWTDGDPEGLRPGGDAVDVYYAGVAAGDPRSFSIGVDYRWFRPQFGDKEKTGTWDAGFMYRPSGFLSVGGALRNISEAEFTSDGLTGGGPEGRRGCACGSRMTYVAGLAVRPAGHRLTLMADASMERDADASDIVYSGGVEAVVADGLTLRGSLTSYPDGGDRRQEFSAGLWFDTAHFGVGGAYRSLEAAVDDVLTVGVSTSEERQRTLFRSGGKVAEIGIGGPLRDFRAGWSLLGDRGRSAQAMIRDIRKAARDDAVDVILLNIKPLGETFLGGPSALVQEIRDEVLRARREHGVKVVAFCEYGAGTQEYFLATAADRIMVHPVTGIEGIGTYVTVKRYTGTTRKLGIDWDYLSAGDYKSTFHSVGAGPLTDVQREGVESLEDAIYEEIIAAVVDGRGLSREKALELCDGRMFVPEVARDEGLIDDIGTYEDAKAVATELAGNDVPEEREDIETVNVSEWRERDYDWGRKPVVAVVGAYGGIHEGEGGTDPLRGGQSIGSETLVKALRAARKNPNVKAVILRVDSGGGSGLASDIIWHETVKLAKEKPFIVSMGNIAASGGYYISIEGEKVFVEPLTITGSIGVVGMKPVFAELYDKVDATYETFRRGEHADQWSTMRKLTDEEREMADELMNWFYGEFIQKAANARGMSEDRLRELAGGRVWMGSQALANGLADERGGLSAAIDYACEKIGVSREDAEVAYYREGTSWVDDVLGGAAAKLGLSRLFHLGDAGMRSLTQLTTVTETPFD